MESVAQERWLALSRYPNCRFSSQGQIQERKRAGWRNVRRRIRDGYFTVKIFDLKIERRKTRTLHSLIIEVFRHRRPAGMQIRHLDGNRTNNAIDNLEYGTCRDNYEDAKRHGTRPPGKTISRTGRKIGREVWSAKLQDEDVRKIRIMRSEGASIKSIAILYKVGQSVVRGIVKLERWKHVV